MPVMKPGLRHPVGVDMSGKARRQYAPTSVKRQQNVDFRTTPFTNHSTTQFTAHFTLTHQPSLQLCPNNITSTLLPSTPRSQQLSRH